MVTDIAKITRIGNHVLLKEYGVSIPDAVRVAFGIQTSSPFQQPDIMGAYMMRCVILLTTRPVLLQRFVSVIFLRSITEYPDLRYSTYGKKPGACNELKNTRGY